MPNETLDPAAPSVRGLDFRWILPRPDSPGGSLLERVLANRPDADDAFLSPALTNLHDPSLMPGVDAAAERMLEALASKQRLVIYGDYDVDGITATAILYHTLLSIFPDARELIRTYVPHRMEEGYGLNADAVRQLGADGARVIVSVDCGITAVEPASVAREIGTDLIITDHHNPDEGASPPDAFAVVHPRLPGSAYPFEHLSGAGVAFKLAWRLCSMHAGGDRAHPAQRDTLMEMLSFAALGTIADVVPLIGENRVLARFGLARLKHTTNPGLGALISASRLDTRDIDSEAVGFRLAPRLNACGRLGHAGAAVELFTSASGSRAAEIAAGLDRQNEARRRIEQEITAEAVEQVESRPATGGRYAIVVSGAGWHPGVAGIVASRLQNRYGCPAVVLCEEDGVCKGSGRSIPAYNLHAGLTRCSELLTTFGGHDMAAGLALPASGVDGFRAAMEQDARDHLAPEDLIPNMRVDADCAIEDLSLDAVRSLDALRPFGHSNPRVRVRLRDMVIRGTRVFGKSGDHLRLRLSDSRDSWIEGVAWGWAERKASLPLGRAIEAVVSPEVSSYSGRVEPVIHDVRVADKP